jgi:hypothetical protein
MNLQKDNSNNDIFDLKRDTTQSNNNINNYEIQIISPTNMDNTFTSIDTLEEEIKFVPDSNFKGSPTEESDSGNNIQLDKDDNYMKALMAEVNKQVGAFKTEMQKSMSDMQTSMFDIQTSINNKFETFTGSLLTAFQGHIGNAKSEVKEEVDVDLKPTIKETVIKTESQMDTAQGFSNDNTIPEDESVRLPEIATTNSIPNLGSTSGNILELDLTNEVSNSSFQQGFLLPEVSVSNEESISQVLESNISSQMVNKNSDDSECNDVNDLQVCTSSEAYVMPPTVSLNVIDDANRFCQSRTKDSNNSSCSLADCVGKNFKGFLIKDFKSKFKEMYSSLLLTLA